MSDYVVDKIVTVADDLTEPRPHVERVPYWDASRHRKFREHRSVIPGLLAQLYDAAVDPVQVTQEGSTSRPKPASRPPLALEALSTYESIAGSALRWVRILRLQPRVTPQSNIRAMVGTVGHHDLDTLEAMHEDLRTWRRWAAVMTGWESPMFAPRMACPACSTFASIRVNADRLMAFCNECQHAWEGDDLAEMAEKVRLAA